MESSLIQAEIVSAQEFPELSSDHGVSSVPHTAIIRGSGEVLDPVTGGYPEAQMVAELQHRLQ